MQQFIENVQTPIVTDNSRVALWGKDSFMIDPLQLNFLEHEKRWNSAAVVRMMQESKIDYVILTMPADRALKWQGFSRIPDPLIPIVKDRYRLAGVLDNFYVYVKK